MTARSATVAAPTSFRSVLHVNEKGGRFGGTEEYVALLTDVLAGLGVTSHLVCGRRGHDLPGALASAHVVEGLADRDGPPGTADEVARLVARLQPDVVYLHNLFDPLVVESLAQLRPRPVLLWYVHDHYPTCLTELRLRDGVACSRLLGEGCVAAVAEGACTRRHADRPLGPADLAQRRGLLAAAARTDAVVVVSRYMQDLVQAHLPDHHRGHVRLLTRPLRPAGAGAGRPRRPDGPAVVAFAGRITPEKGLDVVIEALGRSSVARPVELRVAGVVEHAGHWERCRQLAREAARANPRLTVRHLGHLGYDDTDALLAAADVVVVPSRWPEPLGAVAGEALARGTPIVVSAVGGLETFVDHGCRGGLAAPPGDVGAWAQAIDQLLADPALAAELGERGAAAARAARAERHVAELDQLVAEVRAAAGAGVLAPRLPHRLS